jgi:hypothetical protein
MGLLRALSQIIFSPTTLSRVSNLPGTIDRDIRRAWYVAECVYDALPEWAQPIVWGFGLSIPPAIVAIGLWTVIQN